MLQPLGPSSLKLQSEEARMEYIQRKKDIEYKYASKYFSPLVNEDLLTERELRERVRDALHHLSGEERFEMELEKKRAYRQIALEHDYELNFPDDPRF